MSGLLRPNIIRCRSRTQLVTVGCPQYCLCRFHCHGSPIKTLCHLQSGLCWFRLSNIRRLQIPALQRSVLIWTPLVPNVHDQVTVQNQAGLCWFRLSNIRRLQIPALQRSVLIWTPLVPNVHDQVTVQNQAEM